MPIDLMSPVQALESAALKLVAMKESNKHLAIAQMNADTERMRAEAYKQFVDKQLTPEQKMEISNNDVIISNNKLAEAEEATKQSKQATKQSEQKTLQEQEFTNQLKERNKRKRLDLKSEKNKQNSSKFSQKAEDFKNEQIDAIRNNQVNLGGE